MKGYDHLITHYLIFVNMGLLSGNKIVVFIFIVNLGFSFEILPKISGHGMRILSSGPHSTSPPAHSPSYRMTLMGLSYKFLEDWYFLVMACEICIFLWFICTKVLCLFMNKEKVL